MKYLRTILLLLIPILAQSAEYHKMGYQYLSPVPGAQFVSKHTIILIRFENAQPSIIENLQEFLILTGSKSGAIHGKITLLSDGKTISFRPEHEFAPGETITVKTIPQLPASTNLKTWAFLYSFKIADDENLQTPEPVLHKEQQSATAFDQAYIAPNGVSVPSDFPNLEITVNKKPDSGYIFMNHPNGRNWNVILDNTGSPVWYRRQGGDYRDFKVQKDGNITMAQNGFTSYDQNFNRLRTYNTTAGYNTDNHELQVLANGEYFMIGYRNVRLDMSKIVNGGKTNASISETCIQGFTPQGELTFIWPALEHFDPNEQIGFTVPEDNPTNNSFRFTHMNAIDFDDDGHILLSSRHLSQITKINRETGEIIWRLGGAKNDFTFINDPLQGPRNQHDIRSLGNGHYTVFDNGNTHEPSRSRGVEWVLDTEKMTATLVWEYFSPVIPFSHYMGNCQRLPNGNTLINWAVAQSPRISEVNADGNVEFEMYTRDGNDCYRVFRFPWNGMVERPYLYLEPTVNGITLLFNKFGDPDVAYYKIYGRTSSSPQSLVDSSQATMKTIKNLQAGEYYYFQVKAVDNNGYESDFSNEERSKIIYVETDVNLVKNGDFSNEIDEWIWETSGGASASWELIEGALHYYIENGGTAVYSVQLRQNGATLIQGQQYLFEFDAWADGSRTIEAKVGQDVNPFTNYSRIGLSALSTRKKHFSYTFEMQEPTDVDSRIVINCGTSDLDVYLDNVSLKLVGDAEVEATPVQPQEFTLHANFPNPFNHSTIFQFTIPKKNQVELSIYNALGQRVITLIDKELAAGQHKIAWDGLNENGQVLTSGMYFYKLNFGQNQHIVKKMIMIK